MGLAYNDFNLLELGRIIALETLGVLEGIKKVSRFNIGADNLQNFKKRMTDLGLECEESDFRIMQTRSDKGMINVDITKFTEDEKGDYFLYVSKEKKKAKKAKEYDNIKTNKFSHQKLASLLGYPRCCIEFYEKHRPEAIKIRRDDYTLISLRNSEGFIFPYYTNNIMRYFESGLLTFFPCSYKCEKAIDFGKKMFKAIKKCSPEYADYLKKELRRTMIYTDFEGVHQLKKSVLKDNILTYSDVESTQKNQLHKLLKKADEIKIINHFLVKIMKNGKILKVLKKNSGILIFE